VGSLYQQDNPHPSCPGRGLWCRKALLETGFEVTGIDSSTELLAMARLAAPAAHFVHGSIYGIEIPPCDAIVAAGFRLPGHPLPGR